MANGNQIFEKLPERPEATSAARADLLWIEQLQQNGSFLSKKIAASNLLAQAHAESIYYGLSVAQAAFSDSAASANAAAIANFARRTEKENQNLGGGALVIITAPSMTGYYWPFIAVPSQGLGTLRFYDENWSKDNYWNQASGAQTIESISYNLYARRLPLKQNSAKEVIIRNFQ